MRRPATAATTPKPQTPKKAAARRPRREATDAEAATVPRQRERIDVDDCEVGYVTIRVGGCLVRPIVVAIAVLPRDCDAYHASCSCSCC